MAKKLYELCGIMEPENPWDLQDSSETFIEKFSEDKLIQEIKNQLVVGKVEEEHEKLYSYCWQRVYTTNYDEVPRISTLKSERTLVPVTLSTPRKENDLQDNLCIYINGYIEKLTPKTLDSEFKLTGSSYLAADNLNQSEWGAVFAEDIETADCIVIIGLSLEYDLDIKRFLYNRKAIDKTIFIEADNITEDKRRKLKRFGNVEAITMKKFVEELSAFCENNSRRNLRSECNIYKSFDIYENKNITKSATSFEVYDLFMSGQIRDNLWYRKQGKKVVIIENYYNYLSVLKQFALHNPKDIQFVLSARTVLYDTRMLEVNEMFNIQIGQSAAFDLNKLDKNTEISDLCKILEVNGLWGENSNLTQKEKRNLLTERQKGNSELQGIMLGILRSTDMKKRLRRL